VIPSGLTRESPYLAHPIFNLYKTIPQNLNYSGLLFGSHSDFCLILSGTIPSMSCSGICID
jgi:hypothetical protein